MAQNIPNAKANKIPPIPPTKTPNNPNLTDKLFLFIPENWDGDVYCELEYDVGDV